MRVRDRLRAIDSKLSHMEMFATRQAPLALATGFSGIDAALGIGGLPAGRIVEIFGPPSCGKTAFALQTIAHLQRSGSEAAWIDADRTFDLTFASRLGVDVARLPVAQPASAEDALDMTRHLAHSGAVELIAIDSAAALVPELEIRNGIVLDREGLQWRVLGSQLRRLSAAAARSRACILFLNQTRVRIHSGAAIEISSGGPSLKLYAAVRIAISAVGRRVCFRIVKNRLAAPYATSELEWRSAAGFIQPA